MFIASSFEEAFCYSIDMPTVNIFYTNAAQYSPLMSLAPDLKKYLAKELSCGDIELTPEEVSIRLLETINAGMIADLEVEVTVHAFEERIKKQDEIANNIREYLLSKGIPAKDIRVWVLLPQLGHSW
jgi:hypothetical protein